VTNDKERDPGSSSAEIGKYLDILAKDPKSRVFAPLAEAYRKAGLLDDAVATALEGLRVHPNYLGGRVALGRAYFEKKQYAEAAIEMEKVAGSAPDNIIAHRVLGQIADSRNDLPAAEKAFRMVLLLDPRDLEARQFLESIKEDSPSLAPAPAPAPVEFDEIEGIEDLDLHTEGMYCVLPPAPAPPAPQPSAVPPQSLPSPPPVVADEQIESLFEQFYREPAAPAAPVTARVARGEEMGPRVMDLETTAYTPPDFYIPYEEMQLIDSSQQTQIESPPEMDLGPLGQEYTDDEISLSEPEPEEEEEEPEPPAAAAERSVFDTGTLASIYVKQGFYGRAAEIYRRLLAQSPDDTELGDKLKEVLALQRRESGEEEPAAVFEVPLRTGPELTIGRLETLLETFKGGRPQ